VSESAKLAAPGLRGFYRQNGYAVAEGVLSREETERFAAETDRLLDGQGRAYQPVMNPDREFAAFARIMAHKGLVGLCEELLGSRIHALQSMFYWRPPGTPGRDPHQDNFYARSDPEAYMGAWLALDDADRENGCLFAYPGSHREPILDIVEDTARRATNVGGFRNDRGSSCVVPPQYEKAHLAVGKGSVVFIHGHLIHGSDANISKDRFRRSFIVHYIQQGRSFVEGTHAKRRVIDVYGPEAG
jgi:ectoine hydroxylase-related dioxygenase (phytanoyl-CoA dioxygenase family)